MSTQIILDAAARAAEIGNDLANALMTATEENKPAAKAKFIAVMQHGITQSKDAIVMLENGMDYESWEAYFIKCNSPATLAVMDIVDGELTKLHENVMKNGDLVGFYNEHIHNKMPSIAEMESSIVNLTRIIAEVEAM